MPPTPHARAPEKHADPPRVIVLGAGIAGIAAALRLAEHGVRVIVLETSRRLGGRASSFEDRATGQVLDNCQHVVMRCCTNLLDLYRRLGVIDHIRWQDELFFADRLGRIGSLRADDLPAPLHMTRAWLSFSLLPLRTRLAIARGMAAAMAVPDSALPSLDRISFARWLAQARQPDDAIARFWRVVIVSACNETLERTSARYALKVFRDGFLSRPESYQMGLADVPLRRLYDPARAAIERAGGEIRLGTSVRGLGYCDAENHGERGGAVTHVELADGQTLTADAVVSALPFDRLDKILPDAMRDADARLARLGEMEVSPIIGIHLETRHPDGKPVMTLPHLTFMDSPLHWVFNKGPAEPGGETSGGGRHLHGVISGAHDLVDQPGDAIVALAWDELRRVMPRINSAQLVRGRAVKEKRATFSIQPGVDSLRPGPRGAIGNLLLAGDWCDTGWPATMEGAARSGHRAAEAALAAVGRPPTPLLVPDPPAGALYRLSRAVLSPIARRRRGL